jgi:electron transfer flavoprotein alpha/beta subunit
MPEYRFRTIKKTGHIARQPSNYNLPNDAAAVEEAKQLLDGQTIEIWQGARNVARLDPD